MEGDVKKKQEEEVWDHNAGRIVQTGEKAVRFWARVLGLEKDIEAAILEVREKLSGDMRGRIPVISEYKVDDNFEFIFIVTFELDCLGVVGGEAIIYYTDPARREKALKSRDKLADFIMDNLRKKFPTMDVRTIEPKKHD